MMIAASWLVGTRTKSEVRMRSRELFSEHSLIIQRYKRLTEDQNLIKFLMEMFIKILMGNWSATNVLKFLAFIIDSRFGCGAQEQQKEIQ